MKTMEDFKPVGDLIILRKINKMDQSGIGLLDHKGKMNLIATFTNNENTESFIRAFANSKKVLEAAIWAHHELSIAISFIEWVNPKLEEAMKSKLKQLEQAINDSL